MMHATAVEVSPNSNNIIYITSRFSHSLQKIDISNDTCSILLQLEPVWHQMYQMKQTHALNADNVNFNRLGDYTSKVITALVKQEY